MSRQQPADYARLMSDVQSSADPAGQSVARDALARQLQQDLEADGHKVAWKGDQVMVDGRPYELGGQQTAALRQQPTAPTATTEPVGTPQRGPGTTTPPSASWWDPSDPQGSIMRLVGSQPASSETLRSHAAELQAAGITIEPTNAAGASAKIRLPDGRVVRVGNYFDGGGTPSWGWVEQPGAAGASAVSSPTASPFASGDLPPWLTNPEADPQLTGLADSIPGFSDVYGRMTQVSPEEAGTSDLVKNILAHPESLSPTDVESLKAKNAEELAAAGQAQDQELQHFGANANLGDSPWLAAQRADTAWNRRSATVASNRTVDLTAAQTRQSDRLAAATLGQAFATYKDNKARAAIATAVETVGVKGNLQAAAKNLGMTKGQLLLSYVGQQLNYDINLQALAQKGEQFVAELAQRIAEMKQNDDQFQANFGLALKQFQENKDQNAWTRAHNTFTTQ